MRIFFVGVILATAGAASVAWFNEPPFAADLFYAGIVVGGIGVAVAIVGPLLHGARNGE